MTGLDIKVLGPGCANCQMLEQRTFQALAELDVAAAVETVSDRGRFSDFGVFATPALVINGRVRAHGRLPTLAEIKGWVKKELGQSA